MSWWAGEQHLNSQKWFVQMNLTQPQSPNGHVHSTFTSNKTSFCQTTRLFCYTFSLILDRAPSRGNMSRAELQLTWCFIFVSPQSRVANNHHQLFPTCYPHPAIMRHDTCRTLVDWPAVSFIFIRTKAPIWLGEYIFPWASTQASPFVALTILKEAVFLKQMSV